MAHLNALCKLKQTWSHEFSLSLLLSSHTLPASLSPPLLEGKREEEKEREAEGERERDRQTENTRGIKLYNAL